MSKKVKTNDKGLAVFIKNQSQNLLSWTTDVQTGNGWEVVEL